MISIYTAKRRRAQAAYRVLLGVGVLLAVAGGIDYAVRHDFTKAIEGGIALVAFAGAWLSKQYAKMYRAAEAGDLEEIERLTPQLGEGAPDLFDDSGFQHQTEMYTSPVYSSLLGNIHHRTHRPFD